MVKLAGKRKHGALFILLLLHLPGQITLTIAHQFRPVDIYAIRFSDQGTLTVEG